MLAAAAAGGARAQEPPAATPATQATPAAEAAPVEFRLDLSVEDPATACTDISPTIEVVPGDEFLVAVCALNLPEPPAVVTFFILYDDRVVLAPNVGDCDGRFAAQPDLFDPESPADIPSREESLDCNPDANAGQTTFGDTSLGEGFDCTSGVTEPWGNQPPPTGNAFNGGCISPAGPYTLGPNAPVAMITFRAEAAGRTALTPFLASLVGASNETTGTCNPAVEREMLCFGGIVQVVGEDPLEGLDDDGRDIPWSRIAIITGFALLFVGGIALWFFRPKRRPAA